MPGREVKDWTIGAPKPADAESMAHMHAKSWQETYTREDAEARNRQVIRDALAFMDAERIELRRRLIDRVSVKTDEEFLRVAKDPDNKVIGFVYGICSDEKQELVALYVAGEYHGTEVASQLAEAFLMWCDTRRPIELGVIEDNERAQSFYRKLGFRAVADSLQPFNAYMSEITMVREGE